MTATELTLTLPVPPDPNDWPVTHPMEHAKAKNKYRKQCWIEALRQRRPWKHPPETVVLSATFYLHNRRDPDNLTTSLKWMLDALKQEQTGKMYWRRGIADQKGYFVDDDPDHLHITAVSQEIDRENPRVEVTMFAREEAA